MGIKRGTMKFPFFKSMLVAGALLLAWNCTDNTTVNPANLLPNMAENVQILDQDGQKYYITEDGKVFDEQWNAIGQFADGKITNDSGETIVDNIEDGSLSNGQVVTTDNGDKLVVDGDGKVTDTEGNDVGKVDDNGDIVSNNGDVIAENPNKPASNANQQTTTSSASNGNNNQNNNTTSSASNQNNNNQNNNNQNSSASNGNNNPTSVATVTEGDITHTDNLTQTVAKGSDVSPIVFKGVDQYPQRSWNLYFLQTDFNSENKIATLSGTVPPEFSEKTYTDEITVGDKKYTISITITAGSGGQTGTSSAQQQNPQSSSAQQQNPQPSSQQQTSSSSAATAYSSAVISGSCPTIRKKDGGVSGNAWGSQYWDCCKPHCSWNGNVNKSIFNKPAKLCDINGNEVSPDDGQGSGCGGGSHYTCLSQAPREICSGLSIGLAAGNGSWAQKCGTCLRLTFTGEGEGGKRYNIIGKQMIVMISNIGYDVKGDQFDLMIPGGGVGAFDGCSKQWGVSNDQSLMGAQYGGLRAACNNDVNCLKQKCQALFGSKPSLADGLRGCLWYAEFLEGADNPKFSYEEVECPQELINIYASSF